jgi:hypothetical protein
MLAVAVVFSISIGIPGKSPLNHKRLRELRESKTTHNRVTPLERAFLDAVAILEHRNTCSEFFGGSKSAPVLNELVLRLETRTNDYRIAFRMSGPFVIYKNESGVLYRLFQKTEVNRTGAFYKAKVFVSEPLVPNIGGIPPNTRQARVLILLHELAHLIEGNAGTWLIPDDGDDREVSRANTRIIESKCREEIRAL